MDISSLSINGFCSWILKLVCILFLVNEASSQSTCPAKCQCTALPGGVIVNCAQLSMTSIPSDLPKDVMELNLQNNSISSTSESDFSREYTNLVKLDLSHNRISTWTNGVNTRLPSLRFLDLSNNMMSSLSNETFNGYTLDKLYLSGNGLENLARNVFYGGHIKGLYLDSCKIQTLPSDIFKPLKSSIEVLSLSHNAYSLSLPSALLDGFEFDHLSIKNNEIGNWDFLKKMKATILDISGNNAGELNTKNIPNLRYTTHMYMSNMSIGYLSSSILGNLENVQALSLSENKLFEISSDELKELSALETLDLSNNDLFELPKDLSQYIRNLTALDLSDNMLDEIHPSSFQYMGRLNDLKLSRNHIQVLHENFSSIFDNISTIELNGNPFHCNCEISWLRKWLSETTKKTGVDICHSPDHLKSKLILSLTEDQLVCRAPSIVRVSANMTVYEGDSFTLECIAEGDPAPEIHWESALDDVITITPPISRTKTRTTALWRIHSIKQSHGGAHTCTAINVAGKTIITVDVTVLPPGASTTSKPTVQTETTPSTVAVTTEITTSESTVYESFTTEEATTEAPITMTTENVEMTSKITTAASTETPVKTSENGVITDDGTAYSVSADVTMTTSPSSTMKRQTGASVTLSDKSKRDAVPVDRELPLSYIIVIAVAAILVLTIVVAIVLIFHIRKRLYTKEYNVSTLELAKQKQKTENVV